MAGTNFDSNVYCNFTAGAAKGSAGKDVLLCVFSEDGAKLLAVAGQKGLTINRKASTLDASSKDTAGGWKSKIPGPKEWSIDVDGMLVTSDESHKILGKAFENSDPLCLKVMNRKTKTMMFGGLACLTDYSIEAGFEDLVTYSTTFEGMGALTDGSMLEGAEAEKVKATPADWEKA